MKTLFFILSILLVIGCQSESTQEYKDKQQVQQQQEQYAIGQPIPTFDWSLERHLVVELYKVRNQKAATHSVWRSDRGLIEGDCPSYGYGIPYDTSLTNPLQNEFRTHHGYVGTIEQPEPNGVFSSKNTAATWVMCLGKAGSIEPVYVETKVTVYPGPVVVDYDSNRVQRHGAATVNISTTSGK